MSTRVLLVDDHDVVRTGLRRLLERQADVEIVAEARDGREACRLARELSPDVVLMDVSMPDLNGMEATRQIISDVDGTKVIVLSMHSDPQFVDETLKAGASAYLLKESTTQELPLAIRAVAAGKVYLSPKIAELVVGDYRRHVPDRNRIIVGVLSSREREVLQLLAEGKTSKEIASALGITQKTVESHRAQIMDKLKLHTVAELTKFAIREGLTSLE